MNGLFAVSLLLCLAVIGLDSYAEFQRYDGWYNNQNHHAYGAARTRLIYRSYPQYGDGVYKLAGSSRPPPGLISNKLLKGRDGVASAQNFSALFAFFGQVVSGEIVSTVSSGIVACPPEAIPFKIGDFGTCNANYSLCQNQKLRGNPFFRVQFAESTGWSINNPRTPMNQITAWIDGNFVYGMNQPWADSLRSFHQGLLKFNASSLMPLRNDANVPLVNPNPPALHPELFPNERVYLLGSFKSNQNLPLLAFNIVLHRWHNLVAMRLQRSASLPQTPLSDEELFQRARRLVVAHLQNIIVYEYLPLLLGESLPSYAGYNGGIDPAVSVEFQVAAFRFGHSLIPSGIFVLDKKCQHSTVALCKFWWDSAVAVDAHGLDNVLRGLLGQRAENGDHIFAEGIQERLFGSLRMNAGDLVAANIMRGRDEGVADYNSVRAAFGLPRHSRWAEINQELAQRHPQVFVTLKALYKNISNVDLFVGGMLESQNGLPGPLFRRIIAEQFARIRDGDRFWFENDKNGLFTREEVAEIRKVTLKTIILSTTDIEKAQENVFLYQPEDPEANCGAQPSQLTALQLESCAEPQSFDFFTGSEVSFVATFAGLALFPLICVLVGYIISKRRSEHSLPVQRNKPSRLSATNPATSSFHADNSFPASEYFGPSLKDVQKVQVCFATPSVLSILGRDGKTLRTIDFSLVQNTITIQTSTTKWSSLDYVCVVKLPQDYDLILLFPSDSVLAEFLEKLLLFLHENEKAAEAVTLDLKELRQSLVTREKRKHLLEWFFKTAFQQVLHAKMKTGFSATLPQIVNRLASPAASNKKQKLLSIELTREEFAEALQLKPQSLFVNQMFALADKDCNNYISYPEFIDLLALMSKGNLESKMNLLFHMYDLDDNNVLDTNEFSIMIRSLLEITNKNPNKKDLDVVVESMLFEFGSSKTELNFADFCHIIQRNHDQLWTHFQLSDGDLRNQASVQDLRSVDDRSNFVVENINKSTFDSYWFWLFRYLENNWNDIIIFIVFWLITIGLFLEKTTSFFFFKEESGFRQVLGFSVAVSRGAAAALNFSFSVLLLTACRAIMTMLRETVLGYYVPFDSAIEFHRTVAYACLLFSVVHVVGHGINFYEISTQPPFILNCLFPAFKIDSNELPKFHHWAFATLPGITGILLVLALSVIYVFSTSWARNHIFHVFRVTHRIFPLVYCLLFLHSSLAMLQEPGFHKFALFAVVCYVIDWLINLRSHSVPVKITNVETLPSSVLHLSFKPPKSFRFHSGQWLRVSCEALGENEFHPFTITAAPHEKQVSVYIRAVGPWTRRAFALFSNCLNNKLPFPNVRVDGPYGSTQQNWKKFRSVVLVGGGIGVTPHAAILKDLVHRVYQQGCDVVTKQVNFVWLARNHQQFEWFVDILREVEHLDEKHLIEIDIFITQVLKDFDIRTMMLYVCEDHFKRISNKSLFTGLRAKTHFGRIDFEQYFLAIQKSSQSTKKIGVFSCGPKSMIRSVGLACKKVNKRGCLPSLICSNEIF